MKKSYSCLRLKNIRKILCVCAEGMVRSVAMAIELRMLGFDALPMSYYKHSEETIRMLCGWADVIFVAEGYMIDKLPIEYRKKCIDVGIGPDIWKNPCDADLVDKVLVLIANILLNELG